MAGPRPYDSTVKLVTDVADADETVYLDPASIQALPPVTSTTNGVMTPAMLAALGVETAVTRTSIYAEANGFVQNGVTDESVAFNALLAAAPAGSEIVLTGMIGVKAATISVPSRVSIRGLDRRLHGFKLLNAANLDAVVAQAGWLATTASPTADLPMGTIRDLLIHGNSTNQVSGAGHGLVVFSSYADIARVDIYYPGGDGLRVTSQRRDGTEISNNAVQQHVSRVTVTHAGAHGIHIHDPDPSVDTNVVDGWIKDCIVDTCVGDGIHLDSAGGWLVDGNHVYVCAKNGILAGRANYTRIINNEVEPYGASATAGNYAGVSLGDGTASFIGAINPSVIEGNTIVYGGGAAAGSFIQGIAAFQSSGVSGDVQIGENALRGATHVNGSKAVFLKCQGAGAVLNASVEPQWHVGWDAAFGTQDNGGLVKLQGNGWFRSDKPLTDTVGFARMPAGAGVPTGVPADLSQGIPSMVDSTNGDVYIYVNGGWKLGVAPGTMTRAGTISTAQSTKVATLAMDLQSKASRDIGRPIFTRQGTKFLVANAAFATIYWPWIIKTNVLTGSPADAYFMYYSTDHDAGAGGIAYASGPTPEGPWTNHGQVFVDVTSGTQTETPSVIWNEDESLLFMYYQQNGVSGAVGQQSTMLATSPDGVTWTRVGKVLDPAFVTDQPGDGHTGYLSPFRVGKQWVGYHLYGGTSQPHFAISYSYDGRTWATDQRMLGYASDQVASIGAFAVNWNHSQIVSWGGRLWWIGMAANYSSGTSAKDSRLCMAEIAPDLRHFIGRPEIIIDGTGTGESTNIRALNVYSEGGVLYLYYQCGTGTFLLAKAGA